MTSPSFRTVTVTEPPPRKLVELLMLLEAVVRERDTKWRVSGLLMRPPGLSLRPDMFVKIHGKEGGEEQ